MKHSTLQLFVLVTTLILTACASTHNLNTEGSNFFGGGFIDEELRPGLYRMTARSNMAIWPNFAAAQATWSYRANELCGMDAYVTFDTTAIEGRTQPFPWTLSPGMTISAANYKAAISGYLLCNSTLWSVNQARDFIRAEQVRKEKQAVESLNKELELLGGGECGPTQSGVTAETYFRRAKVLMELQRPVDARYCFMRAQDEDQDHDSTYYKQSCESLGFIYEVGLGVEKNLQAAHVWYRKAGL